MQYIYMSLLLLARTMSDVEWLSDGGILKKKN